MVRTDRQREPAEGRAGDPRSRAGTDLQGRLQGAGVGNGAAPPAVAPAVPAAAAAAVGPG